MRYESARVSVIDLQRQRKDLLSNCYGLEKSCLERVFDYLLMMSEEGETAVRYTFKESIEAIDDDEYQESCCDDCRASYYIKKGSLAKARQEFGESKRALSRMGKNLIKSERELQSSDRSFS